MPATQAQIHLARKGFAFENPANIAAECPTPDGAIIVVIDGGHPMTLPIPPTSRLKRERMVSKVIKELARERGYAAVRQDTGFVIACQLVDVLKLLMSNPNPERAQIRRAFAGMLGVALQTVEKRHYLHVCHDTTEMTTGIATIPGTTEADLQKWFDNNVQWTKVEPRP